MTLNAIVGKLSLFIKNIYPFSKIGQQEVVIENYQKQVNELDQKLSLKISISENLSKENDLLKIQLSELRKVTKARVIPEIPSFFHEAKDVYKFGFKVITKKGEKYLEPIDGGGHITLTSFLYYVINNAKIKETDDAKTAFDKILGAQQELTTYLVDQDQYGEGENWTPAIIVLATREDDCESLSSVAVSAFTYYQLIEQRYPEAYAFIGTGECFGGLGHGFPCLFLDNGKPLEESLFIGESTLHEATASKPLSNVKGTYHCNWGNNSFWHDFRIKPENAWWKSTAGTKRRELTPEEKEKKNDKIKKFWKEGSQ